MSYIIDTFINKSAGLAAVMAVFMIAACDGPPRGGEERALSSISATDTHPAAAGATDASPVLVRYAGRSFTVADLRDEVSRLPARGRKTLEDPQLLEQFVDNFVTSELIFEEGEKRGLADSAALRRQVKDLERRLVIQAVMQEYRSGPVAEDEVRSYYDSHPDEFVSDRVEASHILVKEEKTAREVLAKAGPDNFAALAKEYSIDRSNSGRGGQLGFFGRGRMVKEFEEVAFALKKDGEISDIVKTRFGYHILMRTGREDGTAKAFDEVKNQIRVKLINEQRKERTAAFVGKLKEAARYRLDSDALAAVDLSNR
jgi:peptidyl-prolyl cis-trans isomerase C